MEREHNGQGMGGVSPWCKLRGVNVPKEFALFLQIVLDCISTDWALGPGNNLLTHYIEARRAVPLRPCKA